MLAAPSPDEDEDSVDCALTSRTRKSEEGCDAVSPTLCRRRGVIPILHRRVTFLPCADVCSCLGEGAAWRGPLMLCPPGDVKLRPRWISKPLRPGRHGEQRRPSACRRCRRHRQRERPKHRGRPGRPAGGPLCRDARTDGPAARQRPGQPLRAVAPRCRRPLPSGPS